ncbi:hypothetical protein ACFL3J_03410 [Candidatus Omnitrophota bacterium]
MTAKKKDMQEEFNKFLDQAKVKFHKFGEEMGVLAKKGEKEIVKASKAGKIQLDIMGLSMQKEKLYYDIGKKAAELKAKGKLDVPELESYLKKLHKLESGTQRKKKELSKVGKAKK